MIIQITIIAIFIGAFYMTFRDIHEAHIRRNYFAKRGYILLLATEFGWMLSLLYGSIKFFV